MKTIKKITFLLLAAVIVVSCSKENKIEKNLHSKGGDWEITYYSYMYGNSSVGSFTSESIENCGNFKFSKDGSGTGTFVIGGSSESFAFDYSNTEDKITLVHDGSAIVYDLTWSKNNATLSYNNTTTNSTTGTDYDEETIILKKK